MYIFNNYPHYFNIGGLMFYTLKKVTKKNLIERLVGLVAVDKVFLKEMWLKQLLYNISFILALVLHYIKFSWGRLEPHQPGWGKLNKQQYIYVFLL